MEVLWDGDGVAHGKDIGPVEVLWDGDGVNSSPTACEQTDTCENSTYPIIRMREAKKEIPNLTSP